MTLKSLSLYSHDPQSEEDFRVSLQKVCAPNSSNTSFFSTCSLEYTVPLSELGRQAPLSALILHRGYLILSFYKDRKGHQLFSSKSLYSVSLSGSPKPHPHLVTSTSKEELPVSLWQDTSCQLRVFHICLCLEMCVLEMCVCAF